MQQEFQALAPLNIPSYLGASCILCPTASAPCCDFSEFDDVGFLGIKKTQRLILQIRHFVTSRLLQLSSLCCRQFQGSSYIQTCAWPYAFITAHSNNWHCLLLYLELSTGLLSAGTVIFSSQCLICCVLLWEKTCYYHTFYFLLSNAVQNRQCFNFWYCAVSDGGFRAQARTADHNWPKEYFIQYGNTIKLREVGRMGSHCLETGWAPAAGWWAIAL